jgi:hypothetical protein
MNNVSPYPNPHKAIASTTRKYFSGKTRYKVWWNRPNYSNSKDHAFSGPHWRDGYAHVLDSSSSTSFISHRVASHLPNWTQLPTALIVQMAYGSRLSCEHELVDVTWYLNDYVFSSTLKILPLTHYDLVLGMDWLSYYNPMLVHWEDKWLIIPYHGSSIKLCGMVVNDLQCIAMEVFLGYSHRQGSSHCPSVASGIAVAANSV